MKFDCHEFEGQLIPTTMARARGLSRAAALPLFLASLIMLGAPAASAHDPLEASLPAADETVSVALTEVTLTFGNAPLEGVPSVIQVSDPAGSRVDDDRVVADDRSLTVQVAPTITGVYSVRWQTVSSDAHTISDEYAFTYAGPIPEPTPTPSTPASSPTPSASPAPDALDDTANSGEAASQTEPFIPLIIGVIALVLIVAIIAAVRTVRDKRST